MPTNKHHKRRRFVKRAIIVNKVARDLSLIVCGCLLIGQTPASLEEAGLEGIAYTLWLLCIMGGPLLTIYGTLRRKPALEIYGCLFAALGMLIWFLGAARQEEATNVSYALAAFFLSGVFGQFYRVLQIAENGGR